MDGVRSLGSRCCCCSFAVVWGIFFPIIKFENRKLLSKSNYYYWSCYCTCWIGYHCYSGERYVIFWSGRLQRVSLIGQLIANHWVTQCNWKDASVNGTGDDPFRIDLHLDRAVLCLVNRIAYHWFGVRYKFQYILHTTAKVPPYFFWIEVCLW